MPPPGRPPTRTIRQRYYVGAPPRKVFRALTDPDRIVRWFLSDAKLTPRKGGRYTFTWPGGYAHSGNVLEFVKDSTLALSWPQNDGKNFIGETKVKFTLAPKGKGTLLSITHTGYRKGDDRWLEAMAGTESGWAYYAMNLKSVLEHGNDLRSKHDWQ